MALHRDRPQVNQRLDVIKDVLWVGTPTGEDIHGHFAFVGVGMHRTVAFIQNNDGGKTRRGIGAEFVSNLVDDVGPRQTRAGGHSLKHPSIIETNLSRDVVTIN